MKTEELFEKAVSVVEERGWKRFGGASPTYLTEGPVCIAQALVVASGSFRTGKKGNRLEISNGYILKKAQNALSKELGKDLITEWNDAPGRTKEDVVKRLRKLAGQEATRESSYEGG